MTCARHLRGWLLAAAAVPALPLTLPLAAAAGSPPAATESRQPLPPGAAGTGAAETVRAGLVKAKAEIMAADYRGDLDALSRLRDQVSRWHDDPQLGYLARYWTGFASWRLAINGASLKMSFGDIRAHLDRAAGDFAASARLRDDFADSYAAGALVHGWLAAITAKEPAVSQPHLDSTRQLGARAKALAPDNPRVLWMEGAQFMFAPLPVRSPERAAEVYRRMAAASEGAAAPDSPLPDWGRPEALMSLAFAHMNQAAPDLAAAEAEAREALRLVPEWRYVRDVLLPTIEAKRKPANPPAGNE